MITADFFAGLGVFTHGALAAGADVVLAANHEDDPIRWHKRNHPGIRHVQQDLGELDMRGLPGIDLLVASPCCQGFTPSGRPGQSTKHRVNREKILAKREVARNTAFAVLQAASVRRPRRVLVENVREFLEWAAPDCPAGSAYAAWRGMLEAYGYHVRERIIRADAYGSPQERERVIVTASLDGPIELAPERPDLGAATIGDCLLADNDPRCRWVEIDSKTTKSKAGTMRDRMRATQRRFGSRVTWANVDKAIGRGESERFATFTTKSLSQLYLLDGDRCRPLEARELARGMSLPDSYQVPERVRGPEGRTVAGRLIGNAIDARVARGVVEQVIAA